jgi:hypothetical protein
MSKILIAIGVAVAVAVILAWTHLNNPPAHARTHPAGSVHHHAARDGSTPASATSSHGARNGTYRGESCGQTVGTGPGAYVTEYPTCAGLARMHRIHLRNVRLHPHHHACLIADFTQGPSVVGAAIQIPPVHPAYPLVAGRTYTLHVGMGLQASATGKQDMTTFMFHDKCDHARPIPLSWFKPGPTVTVAPQGWVEEPFQLVIPADAAPGAYHSDVAVRGAPHRGFLGRLFGGQVEEQNDAGAATFVGVTVVS